MNNNDVIRRSPGAPGNGVNEFHTKDIYLATALFEYLIKTYTNEGETVLDNCAGSFTTLEACYNTKRNCYVMEKEAKYCEIGRKRQEDFTRQGRLFA